jgi:hypothetical protein
MEKNEVKIVKKQVEETKAELKSTLDLIDQAVEDYKNDEKLGNFTEKDGVSTIYIDLTKDAVYKEYSGESMLSNDFYDFIEDTYDYMKKANFLVIDFKFPETMSQAEKDKIIKLYHAHYAINYKKARADIRRDRMLSIILFAIGFIFIAIDIAVKVNHPDSVWTEIIDIIGWVFVWQAGDLLFFTTLENQQKCAEYLRLFTAQIK